MRGSAAILVLFMLAGGCEKEPPAIPQLPPEPEEKAAAPNPVEEIGRALMEGTAEEKQKALAAIGNLDEAAQKEHKKALHGLLRHCLSGEEPAFRKEAALVFIKLEDGLGALVRSLDLVPDQDEDVLGVALKALEEFLESSEKKQKLQAVDLLSEIGRPAVGLLLKTLQDQMADVRLGALDALWSIGPIEPGFAGRISALLKDPDPRVRQAAAAAVDRLRADQEDKEQPPPRPPSPPPQPPKGG